MAYLVIYRNCLRKYHNWLFGFTFSTISEVKSTQLRQLIWNWKDLSKGYKIDPSNIEIGVHLKKLWVFEMFWHPMMRIVDEVVITIFGYLRTISNSKGGYFYKVLEGDLEESKLECSVVSMRAQTNEPKRIFSKISC
jgi:hypothetical protein